jgi:integrase
MARKKAGLTAAYIDSECVGVRGEKVLYRHGQHGLGLAVDRRYGDTARKTFFFESKLHGGTFRRVLGEWPGWTVQEAVKAARELRVKIDNGVDPRVEDRDKREAQRKDVLTRSAQRATLREAWTAYLSWRASSTTPLALLTIRDYDVHLRRSFNDWADRKLIKITGKAVLSKHKALIAASRNGKPAQADQAMRYLRAVLNYAIRQDEFVASFPSGNPVLELTYDKAWGIAVKKDRTLLKGQVASWWAAVDTIENIVAATYLRFLLLCGCRRDEALSLTWRDVDFRWNVITFRDTKTGGDRTIPMTSYMRSMLGDLPRVNGWVFPSARSVSGHLREPAKCIDRIEALTGVRVSSHDLRRSFANLAAWPAIPEGPLRRLMGHVAKDVHDGHYTNYQLDLLAVLAQRYEDFIMAEALTPTLDERARGGLYRVK